MKIIKSFAPKAIALALLFPATAKCLEPSNTYYLTITEACSRNTKTKLADGTISATDVPSRVEIRLKVKARPKLEAGSELKDVNAWILTTEGLDAKIEIVPGNVGEIAVTEDGKGSFKVNGQVIDLPAVAKDLVGKEIEVGYEKNEGWGVSKCPQALTDAWAKLGIGDPKYVFALASSPLSFLSGQKTVMIPIKFSFSPESLSLPLALKEISKTSENLAVEASHSLNEALAIPNAVSDKGSTALKAKGILQAGV